MTQSASTSSGKNIIYGLIDPRNGELRYIGLSTKGLERPRCHIRRCNQSSVKSTYVSNWCRSLKKQELEPEIYVIEECKQDELKSKEVDWISYFKFIGANLTNLTNGGDGSFGYKHTEESLRKMHLTHIGKPSPNKGKTGLPPSWNAGTKGVMKHNITSFPKRSVINSNGEIFESVTKAAQQYDCVPSLISMACAGRLKTAKRLTWRYAQCQA